MCEPGCIPMRYIVPADLEPKCFSVFFENCSFPSDGPSWVSDISPFLKFLSSLLAIAGIAGSLSPTSAAMSFEF